MRQLRRQFRLQEVVRLLGELGWAYGVQAAIARRLGVSEATVSRDIQRVILPLYAECPTCGQLRPREWWREAADAAET
jgi:DNA-directed RNA polymerase specialized sigma24 family protein